jgi:hypothetical protein
MDISARFKAFERAITPTSLQIQEALARADAVAKALTGRYYPNVVYTGQHKDIVGSYAKGTNISPPRDVDFVFKLPLSVWYQYHRHSGNGQSALLQAVRQVIKSRYPATDIRGSGPVVAATFISGHSVEVIPAYKDEDGTCLVPRTDDGGSWGVSNYSTEIAFVDESDAKSHGRTRPLIKMLKVWQQHCNVPIKSLALELRAVHFLQAWEYKDHPSHVYDDWMMRDFFAELIKKAGANAPIPGSDDRCYYGDGWVSKARTAYANAAEACMHESENRHWSAANSWRLIFGSRIGY